nr:immunoglobulin heavy chain junction region [Mus musculus]
CARTGYSNYFDYW